MTDQPTPETTEAPARQIYRPISINVGTTEIVVICDPLVNHQGQLAALSVWEVGKTTVPTLLYGFQAVAVYDCLNTLQLLQASHQAAELPTIGEDPPQAPAKKKPRTKQAKG